MIIPHRSSSANISLPPKRYYQIHTEILTACYHDIIPTLGSDLLMSLGSKNLFRHLYYEMKKQEAELIARNDPLALEQYYARVLIMSRFFELPWLVMISSERNDLMRELDEYVTRYLSVKKPHPHDTLFLETVKIDREILHKTIKHVQAKAIVEHLEQIERVFAQMRGSDHFVGSYFASTILTRSYYATFWPASKDRIPFALAGIELTKKFPVDNDLITEFYRLHCSKLLPEKPSVSEFERYLLLAADRIGVPFYFTMLLFPDIVRSGEYTWAEKFIDKHFPHRIELLQIDAALTCSVLLMIYNEGRSNYEEGERYLRLVMDITKGKKLSTSNNVMLRSFDTFFAAMRKGPLEAEQTAERHLRYIRRYGHQKGNSPSVLFIKAVSDLMKVVEYDSKKALEIMEAFKKVRGGGRLLQRLEKIYNKYF